MQFYFLYSVNVVTYTYTVGEIYTVGELKFLNTNQCIPKIKITAFRLLISWLISCLGFLHLVLANLPNFLLGVFAPKVIVVSSKTAESQDPPICCWINCFNSVTTAQLLLPAILF